MGNVPTLEGHQPLFIGGNHRATGTPPNRRMNELKETGKKPTEGEAEDQRH